MTTRSGNRFALSQIASVAMAETRLAGRATHNVLRDLAPIVAWAVASIALGVIVGFAAVILPPLGSFGIVAAAGVVLLWVMPDLPLVSPRLIRKAFFVMVVADLSIPFYYMIQVPGLPWISARRLATFALIVPFLVAVAVSSDVRRQITERIRASMFIFICAAGYLVISALSIITSMLPTESISALSDALLSSYVPFFAMIYIARDKDDVLFILKIICVCALFNTAAGLVEFRLQHRFFIDIFPRGMLETLTENNPTLLPLLGFAGDFRNGLFRAASIFVTPLSFGEFEIITIPIGLFFALHRESLLERMLGWAVVFGGLLGIYVSGSRGGWVGVILSMAVFVAIWSIREAMKSRASLAPATAGVAGAIGFAVIIALIVGSHTTHDMVLGGASQANSTQARYVQWLAAIPFIKSNPITGHGFAMGGYAIQSSIDSYVLSLLIETGIPGLIFFAGLLLLSIWYCVRNYLSDMSESGAMAGAVACSLVAFTANRLVLSQKENHMLIFSLLAIVVVLNYQYARKRVPDRLIRKPTGFMTVPLKAGTNRAEDKRPSAGRSTTDESRREALAAHMASLILAALFLFLLLTCVHMFSRWL
jgi:O-antigen ligase